MGRHRFALLPLAVFFSFYSSLFYLSLSHAETLLGTPQDDTIISTGIYDGIISYEGDDTILIEGSSQIIGDSQQTAESAADTDVVAIDAGSGNDQVTNEGAVSAYADADALPKSETASTSTSHATAINTGDGADGVQNASTIDATAIATATTGDITLTAAGDSSVIAGTKATAEATGISSGVGSNTITNIDTLTVTAEATANAEAIELQLVDKANMDAGVTAEATAIGIFGGDGDVLSDTIINSGAITTGATAEADNTELRVQMMDWSVADTTAFAKAEAVGIKTGPKPNSIENQGTIESTATAQSDLWKVEFNITDWGLASSGLTVESKATGIEGNDGADQITNTGSIGVTATSGADKVGINFTFVDLTVGPGFWGELLGTSAGSADTLSKATAVGISGEGGDDTISNTGIINTSATSTLKGTSVSVGAEGIPKSIIDVLQGSSLASSNPTTETSAIGIRGGDGQDTITNEGFIKAEASSTADDISVNLSLPLLEPIMDMPSPAFALGGAGVTARAKAAGIEGGKGDDSITHKEGLIDVDATSKTLGVTASVAIQGVFDDINYFDLQTSVADASIKSESVATGIDGGEGDDIITNTSTGTINSGATAIADGITASVGIQGKIKEALNVGASIARADTKAITIATGIEGGKGDDTIENAGTVTASAVSTALSVGVSLEAQLSVKKAASVSAAIADTSTQAWATATGISGGEGIDDITNSGKVTATATPEADSTSVSVLFQNVEQGLAVGISYADATTTADGTATGINGGAGNDIIINTKTGEITATADSDSTSASIGVTLTAGFSKEWSAAIGGTITDGTTKAISNATGINGSDGDDTITNSGKIIAKALPDADSASISVGLVGAGDGLTLGFTYADTTTTAEANAVGIDGGSSNDTLTNTSTGQIEVTADPTSSSASVGVTLTGVTKGTGIVGGAALTDGTTKAISTVAGMKGGDGDDTINNSGKITVKSNPDADSASVTVNLGAAMGELGLVGGFSYADATTTAEATAIGIDSGAGNDTITNTGEIEVTTVPASSSASIGVTAQGVLGMGAAVGVSLTDGTTKAISSSTGIVSNDGNDTITNSGTIIVKALPDADSASVSVSLSAAKEGVAAGGTFADATTTAQATATGIDGGEGNDTVINLGTIEVTADSVSSSASVSVSAEGTMTGAALGVALSDGTTKAISDAAGIKGGGGNDTITNSYMTTVTSTADIDGASVTVNLGGAQTGLVAGVAAADVTTTAGSAATGISGGSGDDIIENFDLMTVTAISTIASASVSVNAGIAVTGAAVGAALADGKTVATSSANGLEGGTGNDTITNRGLNVVSATSDVTAASVAVNLAGTKTGLAAGVSLVDGENRAGALAIGMSGGDGDDTIDNYNATSATATTTSKRTNVSVTGNFSLYGAALGASFADATNIAAADARGIEGGEEEDKITNTSILNAVATTTADTKSVALSVNVAVFGLGLGASLATAETTGSALATGISGGEGDDEIENMSTGVITGTSTATAKAKAISVDISYASFSTADATTTASAGSSGITGGNGQDLILNEGIINLGATSTGDGVAGTGQLTGYGAAKVDVNSWAMTAGIDGGTEDDIITNRNEITTLSNATAIGRSVSVNLLGAVFAEAGTDAHALTSGLSGGAGADEVTNEGLIDLTATSNADLTGVSVQLLGYSNSDGSSLSEAIAMGIDGGDGINTITNAQTGSIEATTAAYVDTASVSVNIAGVVKADAGSTATAMAIGISVGKEKDSIRNEGTVTLAATSDTDASATTVTLIGYGNPNAKSISNATVKGIDGADGVNTITNASTGLITGTATALADASSYDIQLAGGAKATAGTEATATAIGIASGKDMDTLRNEGTINLAAGSTLVSNSRSYKIFGVGFANADSKAEAIATGIDGGDGINTITNASSTGSINVSSNASATATSMAANIGVAGSSASTTSKAHSTGVKSGDDQDTILNEGNLSVTAASSTGAGSGDISLLGLSFGDSLTEAIAEGINTGDEKDTIINTGSITVGSDHDNDLPMAYAEVASVSFSLFNISSATFGSKAQATGIIGGGGEDTILNTGTITVGDDDWMAKGRGYGFSGNFFEFFGLTSVGTTAETIATGIYGGYGNDTLLNDTSGVLTVKATSYAEAEGAADNTFGGPAAFASSTTKATATGISGGEGDDVIENKGAIAVVAKTRAHAYSDAEAGWGGPTSDATANATATASGIDAGNGQNLVTNEGQITVNSAASATPIARSDADIGHTEAETTAYAKALAFGILVGNEGNTVTNTTFGTISVTATARTDDGLGNVTKAFQDVHAKATAGSVNIPIAARATGISTGNGADIVKNDGVITVTASSFPWVHAYTSSNVYYPTSDAKTYSSAVAKGITAGGGANEIINTGQINVSAWSHGNPITDSWARDYIATASATADSMATATGIEGEGKISNTPAGEIHVKARATTYVDADTVAEHTTATAALTATATGISAVAGEPTVAAPPVPDQIRNDGKLKVTAVAGEDENGAPQAIIFAKSHIWVRDSFATATGASTAEATGIRAGDRGAEIVNSGTIEVQAREYANLSARAYSRDYNPDPKATSTGNATAAGIKGDDGTYQVVNMLGGKLLVNTDANAYAYSNGDSDGPRYAWGQSTATANAIADGVRVGEGGNLITNNGDIDLTSKATAATESYADAGISSTGKAESTSTAMSDAAGIRTGGGENEILNTGEITVKAWASATAYAYADADGGIGEKEIPLATASTDAKAYGITTGGGNNVIINKGTIAVTAQTETTAVNKTEDDGAWTGTRLMVESAIGVQTGNGDDAIINEGTISATMIRNGLSSLGWGIKSGAGNDQIFLMNGSMTTGHIDLGEGDDRLTLFGTPLVTGDITGAAGVDTLVFEGAGVIGFTPTAFENAVKQGAGVYSMPSLPTMKRVEVNEGTLEVNSSYSMANDSTFQAQVNSDGSHGQLKVNGTAQLAGGLNVIKGPGIYTNGTTYDILLAQVEGKFDSKTLPDGMPLLSFQATTYADRVEVETIAKSCASVAANSPQKKIAQHLDRIMPKATGDMALVLGEFQSLSKEDFDLAFAGLSSDTYNNSRGTTLNSTQQYIKTIQQRMHSLRASLKFAAAETRPEYGVWMQGFGQRGDQSGEDGFTGYDYDLYGGALGADRFLNDHVLLGINLGVSRANIDYEDNMGDGDVDAFIGSLYGSWFTGRYYLDASLSYGYQEYDNTRNITIGAIKRTAASDHDGSIFSGYLEGGYNFSFDHWVLGPFAALNYLYLDEDGFTESGAGSLNLSVDDRQTDALFSQLGAVGAGRLIYENFELMPELRLAWKHDFDIDDQVVTSAFAGAPGVKFSIDGQDVERNSLLVEVGVTIFYKNGLSVPIKYAAELRDGYTAQGILGLIRYEF